jgi:hypothetical protein
MNDPVQPTDPSSPSESSPTQSFPTPPAQPYPTQPYPTRSFPPQSYPPQSYPPQSYPPPTAAQPYPQYAPYPPYQPQPFSAVPSPYRERPVTNAAPAAVAFGILALVVGWVPLVGILGIASGVVAIAFAVRALRLAALGYVSDRGLAIAGSVLASAGILAGLTVHLVILVYAVR